MPVAKISKRTVDAALKEAAPFFLWDTDLKGFGLKVTATKASYLIQYRMDGRASPTKRYTIGGHGSPWTAERARERATDLLEMVRGGTDPIAKERAETDAARLSAITSQRLSFNAYADTYLKRRVATQKRGREVESIFARDLKPFFAEKLVTGIHKTDIAELLDSVGERNGSAANKAHKALKTFFAWAVERGTLDSSPMAGLRPPAPGVGAPRDHTLSDRELRLAWSAAGDLPSPFGQMIRLLTVTGQRLREVAEMSWSEVELEKKLWTIPKTRTKNGETHIVPLSPMACDILKTIPRVKSQGQWVFTTTSDTPVSGFSKAKRRLDVHMTEAVAKEAQGRDEAALPLAPWRLHDLRRTVATGCERIGVPIAVTEAILNHRSGSKRGIVGVYQRHGYADEKRAALERWAHELSRIVSQERKVDTGSIVDLASARAARSALGQ